MGVIKCHALLLAALAAAVAGPSPARGQCRLCSTPTTALSESSEGGPLHLEVETSLDFGPLVLAGQGTGAAVIRPDGSTSAQGALDRVSPRAMVGTASVHGTPGRALRIELPRSLELYSLGGRGHISVDEVTSDLPPDPRLDSSGNLTFRFGGRLTVTGDSEGEYRGDMPIIVDYQ
jgi:hypothetical protein